MKQNWGFLVRHIFWTAQNSKSWALQEISLIHVVSIYKAEKFRKIGEVGLNDDNILAFYDMI